MNSTRKNRTGFTLVEMLVVIFIIVILIGLLMPAINAAREAARATKCFNNQQELAKAIIHYETAKNRLPGVLSFVNPSDPTKSAKVNWVMSIFGELGRMDLWQYWQDGPLDNITTLPKVAVKVGQLICPSNSLVEPVGGLSYVVNMGVYQTKDSGGNVIPDYSVRLFRNRAAWDASATVTENKSEPDQNLTSMKSLTRAVMFSEKKQAGPWNYIPAVIPPPGNFTDLNPLAFQWSPEGIANKIRDLPPGLGSYHRGMIIVTFCDGHSEKIPDTTACWNDPDNQLIGTP